MHKVLLVFAAVVTMAVMPTRALAGPGNIFREVGGDFSAFYCSGAAAMAHKNPYLVEPLRSCENRVQPTPEHAAGVVTPSPLPGYDLALFSILAHLPYESAKMVWYFVLLASIVIAAFSLTRLTGFPTGFVFLALVPVDGFLNLTFGQVPPIVVAALSLAAYLAERGRFVTAAVAASVTLIEPHIGAPACLAMFLFLPKCRVAFGGLAVLFVGASLAMGGLAQNLAYFTTHLPAQARSEIVAADQFSLTALLHLVRIPDRVSLPIGAFSYVVMVVLGISLGRYASKAYATDAFIVLLPAAAVLFGGTYIHDVQFAAALPAALLLCSKDRGRAGTWIVLGLLVVPWFTFGTGGHTMGVLVRLLCAAAIAWMAIIATERRRRLRNRPAIVGGGVLAFGILLSLATIAPHRAASNPLPISHSFLLPQMSAQDNWGAYLRATPSLSETSAREEVEKMPFWLGLLGLLLLAADAPVKAASHVTNGLAEGAREKADARLASSG